MSSINTHVGKMIRKYRKAANLTLQQLADAIHKSRATICKYENGDISMDIETLYEISQVLQVSVPQLTDIGRLQAEADHSSAYAARKSPFFQAKMLYFYFYDGRYNRMKDGVINIHEKEENGSYRATLSICSVSGFPLSISTIRWKKICFIFSIRWSFEHIPMGCFAVSPVQI